MHLFHIMRHSYRSYRPCVTCYVFSSISLSPLISSTVQHTEIFIILHSPPELKDATPWTDRETNTIYTQKYFISYQYNLQYNTINQSINQYNPCSPSSKHTQCITHWHTLLIDKTCNSNLDKTVQLHRAGSTMSRGILSSPVVSLPFQSVIHPEDSSL